MSSHEFVTDDKFEKYGWPFLAPCVEIWLFSDLAPWKKVDLPTLALSMTTETSLLYCVSCHQNYRIGLTFIDPVPFLDTSCYTLRILNNIKHSLSLFTCVAQF